jgi:hypothetical protein
VGAFESCGGFTTRSDPSPIRSQSQSELSKRHQDTECTNQSIRGNRNRQNFTTSHQTRLLLGVLAREIEKPSVSNRPRRRRPETQSRQYVRTRHLHVSVLSQPFGTTFKSRREGLHGHKAELCIVAMRSLLVHRRSLPSANQRNPSCNGEWRNTASPNYRGRPQANCAGCVERNSPKESGTRVAAILPSALTYQSGHTCPVDRERSREFADSSRSFSSSRHDRSDPTQFQNQGLRNDETPPISPPLI